MWPLVSVTLFSSILLMWKCYRTLGYMPRYIAATFPFIVVLFAVSLLSSFGVEISDMLYIVPMAAFLLSPLVVVYHKHRYGEIIDKYFAATKERIENAGRTDN